MLRIESVALPSPEQLEIIIMGMRNPMNSWSKMDSYYESDAAEFIIGENDHKLMCKLAKGGAVHAKFRRMIPVYVTVTAPLYFYKEMDTYKVGTVCNSCSTMHKIHEKEFTLADFSCEHLVDTGFKSRQILQSIVDALNYAREVYLATNSKNWWWQMIQLLPSSYNQTRTYMLNYEVLANIYHSRKNHKLDEWRVFCDWIEGLPYSEIITGEDNL